MYILHYFLIIGEEIISNNSNKRAQDAKSVCVCVMTRNQTHFTTDILSEQLD